MFKAFFNRRRPKTRHFRTHACWQKLRSRRLALESLEPRQMLAAWVPQGPGPSTFGQVENVRDEIGGAIRNEVVGAIHTVLADPTSADILYAGGTNGGLWRTNNATAASENAREAMLRSSSSCRSSGGRLSAGAMVARSSSVATRRRVTWIEETA